MFLVEVQRKRKKMIFELKADPNIYLSKANRMNGFRVIQKF